MFGVVPPPDSSECDTSLTVNVRTYLYMYFWFKGQFLLAFKFHFSECFLCHKAFYLCRKVFSNSSFCIFLSSSSHWYFDVGLLVCGACLLFAWNNSILPSSFTVVYLPICHWLDIELWKKLLSRDFFLFWISDLPPVCFMLLFQ